MIGQETREVERKITAILQILSESATSLGSRTISKTLEQRGITLGERAVRYHLKIMDEKGLTRPVGHKDGRTITPSGLEELRNALVTDKIGFINSKIERLAYQTNIGLRSGTGRTPVDISLFDRKDFTYAVKVMSGIIQAGLCSSSMVALAGEGSKLGEITVPPGKVGFATICNVAVNGCLLKSGIPVHARFGGLLQFKSGQPYRFVDIIEFSGSTIDPSDIFIAGKMTDILKTAVSGNGKVLAHYYEIPLLSAGKADELLERLRHSGLLGFAILSRPGEMLCEIPHNQDKLGLVTLSGLNPAAGAVESGIPVTNYPMSCLLEASCLRPFTELL